jgi:hypothetical protein
MISGSRKLVVFNVTISNDNKNTSIDTSKLDQFSDNNLVCDVFFIFMRQLNSKYYLPNSTYLFIGFLAWIGCKYLCYKSSELFYNLT